MQQIHKSPTVIVYKSSIGVTRPGIESKPLGPIIFISGRASFHYKLPPIWS